MITHLAFLLACGPKKTEVVDVEPTTVSSRKYAQRPAPLPKKSFTPPPLETAQLSNEIPFFVQSNMEVPLVRIWLSFDAGTWTDPSEWRLLAAWSQGRFRIGVMWVLLDWFRG